MRLLRVPGLVLDRDAAAAGDGRNHGPLRTARTRKPPNFGLGKPPPLTNQTPHALLLKSMDVDDQ